METGQTVTKHPIARKKEVEKQNLKPGKRHRASLERKVHPARSVADSIQLPEGSKGQIPSHIKQVRDYSGVKTSKEWG